MRNGGRVGNHELFTADWRGGTWGRRRRELTDHDIELLWEGGGNWVDIDTENKQEVGPVLSGGWPCSLRRLALFSQEVGPVLSGGWPCSLS